MVIPVTHCRCGWSGTGPHPCHVCGAPAIVRFYNPTLVPLAGVAMKMEASETYGCDACWEKFRTYLQMDRTILRFLRECVRA